MTVLSESQVLSELRKKSQTSSRGNYLAMYSSWLGGIVTDPTFMLVPIDDHIVHRGDGVFEAFRSLSGQLVEMEAHLDRLEHSAHSIDLKLPFARQRILEICQELLGMAPQDTDVLFRLYVSRGPGGFTTNPYESVGSQLYIVMTRFQVPKSFQYEKGVKAGKSRVLAKPSPYSQIKSCNYLPNVMMKKEAVDLRLDYTLCFTDKGELAEGSTENVMIVTKKGEVLAPLFDYTLKGTTLNRLMGLLHAEVKREDSLIRKVSLYRLGVKDIDEAAEIMMIGTTIGVLPVTEWEGKVVGDGVPGPVFQKCHQLMDQYYSGRLLIE